MSERFIPKYLKAGAGILFISALAIGGARKIGELQVDNSFLFNCRDKTGDYNICLISDHDSINLIHTPHARVGYPSWSPDRKSFVYEAINSATNEPSVYKIDILGNPTLLVDGGFSFNPQWIKDGPYKGKVLITAGGFDARSGARPYIIDPSKLNLSSEMKEVDLGGEFTGIPRATISPDGQTLLMETYDEKMKGSRMWIKKLNDNSLPFEPMVTFQNDSLSFPAFSPDSNKLAFTYYAQGGTNGTYLWIKNISNGEVINLNIQTAQFDWSPDGKKIVYQTDYGIFTIDIATKEILQLTTNGNNSDMTPTWGTDGKIYYNESINNKLILHRVNPDGSSNESVLIADQNTSQGFSPRKVFFGPQK